METLSAVIAKRRENQHRAGTRPQWKGSHLTLLDQFDQSVRVYGKQTAFEYMGAKLTYDELDRLSQDFAAFLHHDLRLMPGTRIAIQLPNLLQYPVAILAALRAGLVIVNINPQAEPGEMKRILVDSGAEVILILENHAHKLEHVLYSTSVDHIIVTGTGDLLGKFRKMLVNGMARHVKKLVPPFDLSGSMSFQNALRWGSRHSYVPVEVRKEDTAFIQYTSGATGASKGVLLSHANLVANVEQLYALYVARLNPGHELAIAALPFYHIYGLGMSCFTMIKLGARSILIPDSTDRKALIRELCKYPFSVINGNFSVYKGILEHADFQHIDFSRLKLVSSGGTGRDSAVASQWKEKTGIAITEGYGLTETSAVLTSQVPMAGRENELSVGLPLPGTEIIIADDYEKEVPLGKSGEIYARGPQVMTGYWNRAEETVRAFTIDGWLKTGDIGVMDKNGFVRFVGKKHEMMGGCL